MLALVMSRLLVEEIDYGDPLPVFARFAGLPGAIFLDSALTSATVGRYSFIAAEPFLTLKSRDGQIDDGERRFCADPFAVLAEHLARYRTEPEPALPPFQTGAAGYFAYDLARHLERLPAHRIDDQPMPDLLLGFYDWTIAFDHAERRALVMASGHPASDDAARRERAKARLAWVGRRLAEPVTLPSANLVALPRPDLDRARHEAGVRRIIDYILAGDIYQANLTQRFSATLPPEADPFSLYCALRRRNPAPFAAYLRHGDLAVVSASPERFLKLRNGRVETRPIKGTRPRGATPAEDRALGEELLASEKDRAENLMIVDLLRNDLSRVCRDHSVEVPVLFGLESFATVHHLVSVVTGQLAPGKAAVDLLRAAFPGGSITGAPKIRAMEIIAELEPTRRGVYCGSVGYIGFDGAMDTSIVIRTMLIRSRQLTFQVGGGIVADSDPAAEYDECLAKAAALIDTLSGRVP
jgi:para-aminobenzoate synthetase component I